MIIGNFGGGYPTWVYAPCGSASEQPPPLFDYHRRRCAGGIAGADISSVFLSAVLISVPAWSPPASKPNTSSTQYLIGVGVNYTAQTYALGVEMLIPGNKQTGSHLGVIAQFHLYFDDLLPNSLGKPIVNWWN